VIILELDLDEKLEKANIGQLSVGLVSAKT